MNIEQIAKRSKQRAESLAVMPASPAVSTGAAAASALIATTRKGEIHDHQPSLYSRVTPR
jgi:hypothetical protein